MFQLSWNQVTPRHHLHHCTELQQFYRTNATHRELNLCSEFYIKCGEEITNNLVSDIISKQAGNKYFTTQIMKMKRMGVRDLIVSFAWRNLAFIVRWAYNAEQKEKFLLIYLELICIGLENDWPHTYFFLAGSHMRWQSLNYKLKVVNKWRKLINYALSWNVIAHEIFCYSMTQNYDLNYRSQIRY